MNKSTLAIVALLAMGTLVTACGGGGGSNSALPAHQTTPGSSTSARGAAAFTITIPAATTSADVRKPAYVSAATQSVSVVETDGAATPEPDVAAGVSVAPTPTPLPPVVANLTPTSPNCATGPSGVSCTIVVPANAGPDSFLITTYDGLNATGNPLSSGTVFATIVSGTANTTYAITLGGVVGSIVVTLADPYAPVGTSTVVQVQAKDASGATIIGPYDNPITLSTGSNASLNIMSVLDSGASFYSTLTPVGNTTSPIVVTATGDGHTGTATLTPGSAFVNYTLGNDGVNDLSGFPATVGPDGKFYYGTIGSTICSADVCAGTNGSVGQLNPATGAFTEIPIAAEPTSLFFTPDGALWVAAYSSSSLLRFPPGNFTAGAMQTIPLPGGGKPRSLTLGADGNLWFSDTWNYSVGEINPNGPYATASITEYSVPNGPAGTGDYYNHLGGIASGSDGNLYVTDYYNGVIDQISTAGVTLNQFITSEEVTLNPEGGDSFPRFIVKGSDGNMYFTEGGQGFSEPYNGRLDSLTTSGTFGNIPLAAYQHEPDSIAAGNGELVFSDLGNQSLGIYTLGASSPVELPTTDTFSYQTNGNAPNGVAVAADGSAWYMCDGGVSAPLCAGHLLLTSAWSLFPGRTINLAGLGVQSAQLIGIGESGNSGPFTYATSNASVATAVGLSDHNFNIVGTGAGTATITVTDAHTRSVTVTVNVTATEGTVQSIHTKSAKKQ